MMRVALPIAAMVMVSTAAAQTESVAVPSTSSQFCGVTSAFAISREEGLAELKKCQGGDTVLIPATSLHLVARFCDFTKSMVSTGDRVVCVLQGGDRAIRKK